MKNNYYIGIDLGTTNTVVTIGEKNPIDGTLYRRNCKIKQYDNLKNEITAEILPSVLYGDGKDIIVGKYAQEMKNKNSSNVVYNSKRSMGTDIVFPINGKYLQAWEVAAEILKCCRDSICESNFTNDIDEAIITVPASFDHDKIEDTKRAAEKAGFDKSKIHVLHEPTAALIDFVYNAANNTVTPLSFEQKKRLIVLDLGGGTCDISIIDTQVINDEIILEEKAINRYEEVGGIDFDYRCADYLKKYICDTYNIKYDNYDDEQQREMYGKLVVFAEQMKETFSNRIKYAKKRGEPLSESDLTITRTFNNYVENFDVTITMTYNDYIESIKALLYKPETKALTNDELEKSKNIESPIIETLSKYNISADSIDYIYLTGGMSNFPPIMERVKTILNKSDNDVKVAYEPLKSVSCGASIYHYYKVKETKLKMIEDGEHLSFNTIVEEINSNHKAIKPKQVFSESIMINLLEGLPKVVIPENKEYPCQDVLEDVLTVTSPAGIAIEVYCGENQYDTKMRKQKTYIKPFDTPVPEGTMLDIDYTIDEDKSLEMKLIIKGHERQIVPLSRVERLDIKTIDDPALKVVSSFSGLNSSINKLFYYIIPEEYVIRLTNVFTKYKNQFEPNKSFTDSILYELTDICDDLMDMGINPIEALLFSSKVCNQKLISKTGLLNIIKTIIQDITGKDREGSLKVIEHILEKWTWAPQLKIIYMVCADTRQKDLIKKCYTSYKNGKFENTYLKYEILKVLISSGADYLIPEIFNIVSNLDKNSGTDSAIWQYFDVNFIKQFSNESIKEMLELSSYVSTDNRYSQNLFNRLKRNSESDNTSLRNIEDQDKIIEYFDSRDPRQRRHACVEARFIKSPRVSEKLFLKLKYEKENLRVDEICEGLLSIAYLYGEGNCLDHTAEEVKGLIEKYEADDDPEYIINCYAAKIITCLYDQREYFDKLFDRLINGCYSHKQIVRIIRQVRSIRFRFPENYRELMASYLKNTNDCFELRKIVIFYSIVVSEERSNKLEDIIFNLFEKKDLTERYKIELYRTILLFIKKNRNDSNMSHYNKLLFKIKDSSEYSNEIRILANDILKSSEITEGM